MTFWTPAIAATLLIFLVGMDSVMMPIATSAIVEEFNTDVGSIQAAVALTSLVAAPLYITGGKLGDIHGRKRMFTLGTVLYGIGVLAAAVAPSMTVLIVGWSVVRGLGMALALPASIGLLIASYSGGESRNRAFAIFGVGGAAASLVGPLLMGFSADNLSWRLPFALELGVVVAILLFARSIQETVKAEGGSVDWVGTALAFLSVGSIILGSMLGGPYGWWGAKRPFLVGEIEFNPMGLSPATVLFALGAGLAALLLSRLYRMEERGEQPLFSMRLFDDRTFLAAWVAALFAFVVNGAIPFIVPVFSQEALGFDSGQSALAIAAFSVGSILLGIASGTLIQRMQSRSLMQVFLLVMGAGIVWLFFAVEVDASLGRLLLPMFVIGCGFGVVGAQIPNITLSGLSSLQQGEGSGVAETGKELGVGLGTAVIGSIMLSAALSGFVNTVAREIDVELTREERKAVILELEDETFPREAMDELEQLVPELERVGQQSYVEGFQVALGVLFGVTMVAVLAASFIPKVERQAVTSPEVKERVADVSNLRL